jgi:predicted Fe-Mo cluster-binding NifX family protein
MKIAIAVDKQAQKVSGHAGQARHWLIHDCQPGATLPQGELIVLTEQQLPHHFRKDGPHPLHGVEVIVAGSAGDGLVRHMGQWGAQVLLNGETEPQLALTRILAGEALPETRFDITTTLYKLRDLLSRH